MDKLEQALVLFSLSVTSIVLTAAGFFFLVDLAESRIDWDAGAIDELMAVFFLQALFFGFLLVRMRKGKWGFFRSRRDS